MVLFMVAVAYWILAHVLMAVEGADSLLARAIGKDRKGVVSVIIYARPFRSHVLRSGWPRRSMWPSA